MIKNYFKIAFRNMLKHKTYATINIFGMSLAFLCGLLLFLNAFFELSFDDFFLDGDRIYKVYNYSLHEEGPERGSTMAYPAAPTFKNEINEVEFSTRFMWGGSNVRYQNRKIDLQINFVDKDFFKVFNFGIANGNKANPLDDLSSAVITKHAAKKIFNNENPIGKIISVRVQNEWKDLTVTAVADDFPENSSIKFDILARPELREDYSENKENWNMQHHDVYLKLAANASQKSVEQKLREVYKKHISIDSSDVIKSGYKKDENGDFFSFRLLPVNQIHFDNEIGSGESTVSKTYIYTLLLICFFILAIASFNFINLNIARSFTRAKEVGVRKSLGASSHQIFMQVWGESLMICIFALLVGIIASILLIPYFNQLFDAKLSLNIFKNPSAIISIFSGLLIISLIAGGYPALIISKYNTASVLKGKVSLKKPGFFRNTLIVLQFGMACLLMTCTLIAYNQFDFMCSMPLGFNKEAVISVPLSGDSNGRYVIEQLRNKLNNQSSIVSITGSNINFGIGKDGGTSMMSRGFGYKDKSIFTNWMSVDYEFLKTMDIKLLNGRDFSRDFTSDTLEGVLVTEAMAKQFGVKNPLGLNFSLDTALPDLKIVGIIDDFHLYSLHKETEALTIDISPSSPLSYAFIKTKNQNPIAAMNLVKKAFKEIMPGKEFEASFLNENTERWYQKEKRLSMLFGISSIVAILLSCLGLFALALLMIQQRIKEIGVRKVLGASIFHINQLLAKDFIKLVLVSICIATPLAWYLMNKWLQDFPYRIQIHWQTFAIVSILAIAISLITISFHTIKASLQKPVNNLRSE
jgi:ABC-type antimicrobial peptide transport system permease subunit